VPRHLPFDGRAFRLRMGLRPMAPGAWLEPDDHRAADLARKDELLDRRRDDVVALAADPDGRGRDACFELVDELVRISGEPASPTARHPIEAAARLTQEDWCVHLPDEQGRWRLVAACVCFPTRWVLGDKIGRTVREIHAPVPFYDEQLADPVDAFFDRLRPGVAHGVWRLNWNLLDDAALFQPGRVGDGASGPVVTARDAGEQVWLRVERQTLVRLATSGAVVFGIRVHVDPLGSLVGDAAALDRLDRSLRALPGPTWEDKRLSEYGGAVLDWIAAHR
jgi:dimethylamine monooxygenase subunit A